MTKNKSEYHAQTGKAEQARAICHYSAFFIEKPSLSSLTKTLS